MIAHLLTNVPMAPGSAGTCHSCGAALEYGRDIWAEHPSVFKAIRLMPRCDATQPPQPAIDPKKAQLFLMDLVLVCLKHGLSLGHEDGHGAFLVENISAHNLERLLDAQRRPR